MEKIVANFNISYIQYIDTNGQPHPDFPENLRNESFLTLLYKKMTLARLFDERAVELVKQKKLLFHASSRGEEAVGVGYVSAMTTDDILVAPYRHYPAEIWRGNENMSVDMMMRILLYWGGDERGNDFQGSVKDDLPICVTVGFQCTHAAGVALAIKNEGRAVVCTLGDGATSQGDFSEALNAVGVGRLPAVYIISNNQWAISTPRSMQTRAKTLAQKGIFGGIRNCVQVDGNDVIAVYSVANKALLCARAGKGPSVIEAITYRLSPHTTVDMASRYRSPEEVKEAEKIEPIIRMRKFLELEGYWDESKQKKLEMWCKELVEQAVINYSDISSRPPEAIFEYLHAELPSVLREQREEVIANNKERR